MGGRGLGSEGERGRGTRPRARGAWPRTVRRARARWHPDFFVPLCGRRGRITRIIIRGFVGTRQRWSRAFTGSHSHLEVFFEGSCCASGQPKVLPGVASTTAMPLFSKKPLPTDRLFKAVGARLAADPSSRARAAQATSTPTRKKRRGTPRGGSARARGCTTSPTTQTPPRRSSSRCSRGATSRRFATSSPTADRTRRRGRCC